MESFRDSLIQRILISNDFGKRSIQKIFLNFFEVNGPYILPFQEHD